LEKKARLIDQLSSRQFFWFQKVQLLADIIPDGVWLTRVYSREEKRAQPARRSSRQQEADDQAGQATVLVVQGTAVAYKIQDAVALVGTFIKNLQGSEAFAGDFKEIKLNNIAKTSIGEMDVMKFDLLCEQK